MADAKREGKMVYHHAMIFIMHSSIKSLKTPIKFLVIFLQPNLPESKQNPTKKKKQFSY